jgi:hypothetical protein
VTLTLVGRDGTRRLGSTLRRTVVLAATDPTVNSR